MLPLLPCALLPARRPRRSRKWLLEIAAGLALTLAGLIILTTGCTAGADHSLSITGPYDTSIHFAWRIPATNAPATNATTATIVQTVTRP